jgi:UDP-N-acetylglucosamine 2-epimerase
MDNFDYLRNSNLMKILCCAGTRPEIIKMAPLARALVAAGIETAVVDAGQHASEISGPLFDFFGLTMHKRLDVLRPNTSLVSLNARLLHALGDLVEETRPDVVLVQGDTASALQMGMAAFLHGVRVGHVEAGLRSDNLYSPFPEEFNRSILGRFSHWNFAPTQRAVTRLREENVPGGIHLTGNTIVDAVHLSLKLLDGYRERYPEALPARLDQKFQGLRRIVVTMHRRENWGPGIRGVAEAVRDLLMSRQDVAFVWALHPNPAVAGTVREVLGGLCHDDASRLALVPPLGYPDMIWLMKDSWLLLTDSGGIQEESISLGLPVLVARTETERPEVLECGAGELVGTRRQIVLDAVLKLLEDPVKYRSMASVADNPIGDGRASLRIMASLAASAP